MTGSARREFSTGERVLKTEEYQANFDGRAEIEEVDSKGEPVRIVFTIGKFTKTDDGVTVDVLKSGSVLVTDSSQKEPISFQDGTIDKPVREAFSLLYSPTKRDAASDDEAFGTKEAKRVGDSWNMNVALTAKGLKDETGVTVAPGHLTGMVSLIGKDDVAGSACLSLREELKTDSFRLEHYLPQGLALEQATLQGNSQKCIPIESSDLFYREGIDLDLVGEIRSDDGEKIHLKAHLMKNATWVASENK